MSAEDMDALIRGSFPRKGRSPFYALGLLMVALVMVLLQLIYLALIVAAGWGLVWHLTENTSVLTTPGRSLIARALLYLTPGFAGAVLVIFLVKPIFASPRVRGFRFRFLKMTCRRCSP